MSVTVYTAGPACPQCVATFRRLKEREVEFTKVDLRDVQSAHAYVTGELGYSQAPVVVVDGEPENHWYGFQPDKIDRLVSGTVS